ncbi:MAG TPA: hypothetical protein VF331_24050 [Polyangiales bacterium]
MKTLWLNLGSLALMVMGCASSGGGSRATDADYDDVAQALSSVVVTGDHGGETGSFYDATQLALGTPALGFAAGASGRFQGKHAGLTYEYTTMCKDGGGNAMSSCDLTTAAATVTVSWSGNLVTPNLTATATHQAELRLSALQSNTVSVSGDGNFEFDTHFQSAWRQVQRDYHLGYTVAYQDVQVRRVPLQVVGGTVSYTIDAERMVSSANKHVDASFRIASNLEFATDGSAQLTLDGTHQYAINLVSGAVAKR